MGKIRQIESGFAYHSGWMKGLKFERFINEETGQISIGDVDYGAADYRIRSRHGTTVAFTEEAARKEAERLRGQVYRRDTVETRSGEVVRHWAAVPPTERDVYHG